jgi:hypothetical protein
MNPIVVDMRIQTERHEHVSIQQPGQASSSSASIRRTMSAVIGRRPREIAKPLRFAGAADRPAGGFAPPNDRRNNRLTAALMVQSSALASDFAIA